MLEVVIKWVFPRCIKSTVGYVHVMGTHPQPHWSDWSSTNEKFHFFTWIGNDRGHIICHNKTNRSRLFADSTPSWNNNNNNTGALPTERFLCAAVLLTVIPQTPVVRCVRFVQRSRKCAGRGREGGGGGVWKVCKRRSAYEATGWRSYRNRWGWEVSRQSEAQSRRFPLPLFTPAQHGDH